MLWGESMVYCKYCGMPVDDSKEVRCPRCGEFLENTESKKRSNMLPIVIVICVAVVIVTCVVVGAFVLVPDNETAETENGEANVVVENKVPDGVPTSRVPFGAKPDNAGDYDYTPTNPPTTKEDGISSGVFSVSAGQNGYVSYETPSHAGVNVRDAKSTNAKKLVTLPEGTPLTILETKTANAGGYVLVEVDYNGNNYVGYVFIQYVVPLVGSEYENYYTEAEFTQDSPSTPYISYDTPAGAGVNLVTKPGSDGEIIVNLPEGTPVNYMEGGKHYDSYVYVIVDVDGISQTGYILERYMIT